MSKKPAAAVAVKAKAKSKAKSPTPEPVAEKRLLPEQILALNRITSDKLIKAARCEVKDGKTYEVDFGVRVTGKVIVGSRANCTFNDSPPPGDILQAVLAQFGPRKREAIVNALIQSGVKTVIAPDEKPVEGLADLADRLINGLTVKSTGTKRGNVTGDVDVQLIEWSV